MFSKMHLKYKILLGFLLVSSFSLLVGGVSYFYLQKVIAKYDHVVKINMVNSNKMEEMKTSVYAMRSKYFYLIGFTKGNATLPKILLDEIELEKNKYMRLDKEYNSIPFVPGEAEVYNKVSDTWKKLLDINEKLVETYTKEGITEKTIDVLNNSYTPASLEYISAIDALIDFQTSESLKWIKESADTAAISNRISFIIMGLSFAISILIAVLLSNSLTGKLISVINDLRDTSPRLTTSANTMSSLSTELSSCATEQAASVQETAASLEEISAMIRRNSDNASNAKNSSNISLDSVKKGQLAVTNMLTAMDEINTNNDAFNDFMAKNSEELSEMVQVITNISDKTKVINDIVFQTKLLSFNASVEAARAGEQGKGFAVVAEEVGNLAQMSGNAANEIKGLLEESIVKVNRIVDATKSQVEKLVIDGKDKIQIGISRAKECDSSLIEISSTVTSVEYLVAEVAHASGEQSQGIDEVNKAMGQIDEVTNQNSIASQSVSVNAAEVLQLSIGIKGSCDSLVSLLTGGGNLTLVPPTVVASKKPIAKVDIKKPIEAIKPNIKPELSLVKEPVKAEVKIKLEPKLKEEEAPKVATASSTTAKKASLTISGLPSSEDHRFEDV